MKINRRYIVKKYHEFNKEYFSNQISGEICVDFQELWTKDRLAECGRSKMASIFRTTVYIMNNIYFNKHLLKFDLSSDVIDTILVHEMIHLYLMDYTRKIKNHGTVFQRECRRIKKLNPNLDLCYNRSRSIRKSKIPKYWEFCKEEVNEK